MTTCHPPRLQRVARAALAAAAIGMPCPGALAQSSPYYVGGSINYSHDTNLLRVANGAFAPSGYDKSDSITSAALLAGLDQSFGRQRVFGTATVRSNRFANNTIYNNQSHALSGGLDWSTAERLSGLLSVNAGRNLSSFNLQEIGLLEAKNLESSQGVDAVVRWGLVTEYSLEVSAGQREVKNSLDRPAVQARNYHQDTGALGLRWRPSTATQMGLALRGTQGRYPKFRPLPGGGFQADRFQRQDVDLTFSHRPSGLSTLDLRLSYGKTTYDLANQRDFSGLTGALGWNWQASSKVRLNTRLARDTGQDSYAVTTFFGTPGTADYSRVNTSLRTRADYELTARVGINLAVAYSDFEQVNTQPDILAPRITKNHDRYTTVSMGARWQPHRSTQVGCDLSNETRRSVTQAAGLKANTYSCFAQFTLQ